MWGGPWSGVHLHGKIEKGFRKSHLSVALFLSTLSTSETQRIIKESPQKKNSNKQTKLKQSRY